MQTANHALEIIGRAARNKGIARNAARVYAKQGLTIDMRDAFDQDDLFNPDESDDDAGKGEGGVQDGPSLDEGERGIALTDTPDEPQGEE